MIYYVILCDNMWCCFCYHMMLFVFICFHMFSDAFHLFSYVFMSYDVICFHMFSYVFLCFHYSSCSPSFLVPRRARVQINQNLLAAEAAWEKHRCQLCLGRRSLRAAFYVRRPVRFRFGLCLLNPKSPQHNPTISHHNPPHNPKVETSCWPKLTKNLLMFVSL